MDKKLLAGLLVVLVLLVGGIFLYRNSTPTNNMSTNPTNTPSPVSDSTSSAQLKVEDLKVGTGSAVQSGDTVVIHYTGKLTDGTKFDSSLDRGKPFETQIGVGQVIEGWDQGVVGMKVGGKRLLTIPPSLGYGSRGVGNVIPPNSTLVFEVELLGIK